MQNQQKLSDINELFSNIQIELNKQEEIENSNREDLDDNDKSLAEEQDLL